MTVRTRTTCRAALIGILAAALLPTGAAGQHDRTLSYGAPRDVGMSPSILAGALGLYREAIDRGDLVGAVVLIARQGRVVLHEALGARDRERNLPMERDTMFRMASNTKPVIAAAVARLVDEGRLEYTDLVRSHLPTWDNYRAGFVTIGHLLSHTSGLRISSLFLEPVEPRSTLQQEAARFGEVGAAVPPGESYSYSNPGYNTLGALVEIASGQPLEAYLDSVIYTPLGMVDSYNHRKGHPLDGKLDRMGAVYYRRDSGGTWEAGGTPGGPVAYPFARGSGGMISTAWDYAIFAQMFLNGGTYGGARILEPESVALMTSPKPHTSGRYGFGWGIEDGTFGHGGSDGTDAWIDPEREIVGLVFTQTPRGRPSLQRFRDLVNLALNEP